MAGTVSGLRASRDTGPDKPVGDDIAQSGTTKANLIARRSTRSNGWSLPKILSTPALNLASSKL
jgi:hypothetical protein